MLACVDVGYGEESALAACLGFQAWSDAEEACCARVRITHVEPYEPGAFYKRELPCVLAALRALDRPVEVVVIDGYVWLSEGDSPGLGAHLFDALDRRVVVVGCAKTAFRGSSFALPVLRGHSQKPLFVTAAGVAPETAADWVRAMHGAHRIPTLLKRVDQWSRESSRGELGPPG
ncbi:MAG: endonuclease V [Polyangiaceae bacterium]